VSEVNGLALGAVAAGSVFLYAALKGKTVVGSVQALIKGQAPSTSASSNPVPIASDIANAAAAASGSVTLGGAGTPVITGGGSKAQNIALAQQMAAARGWTGQQWNDLFALWDRESARTWSPTVTNPTSGAYGIPQSLPADKMASAGADWQTNPATQIKWGLDYIAGRYGTPSAAWAHELSNNWY
jgi:hypothetical protein